MTIQKINIPSFEDFKIGDYYIDWCTGINGYYGGPYEITCMQKFDDHWVVSWGMFEKVPADYPKCKEPEEFRIEDDNMFNKCD